MRARRGAVDKDTSLKLRDVDGCTPLIRAARMPRAVTGIRRLVRAGADIDAMSSSGETALMVASSSGRLANVKVLLDLGADATIVNREGESALTYAIVWQQRRVVRLLLASGVSPNRPRRPWSPLMYAAFEGDLEICKMLVKSGAHRRPRTPAAGTQPTSPRRRGT